VHREMMKNESKNECQNQACLDNLKKSAMGKGEENTNHSDQIRIDIRKTDNQTIGLILVYWRTRQLD
jgi:hypothetical protein